MYDNSLGTEFAIYPTDEGNPTLETQARLILDRIVQFISVNIAIPYEFIIYFKTDGLGNFRFYFSYDGHLVALSGSKVVSETVIHTPTEDDDWDEWSEEVITDGPFIEVNPTNFAFAGLISSEILNYITNYAN